MSSTASRTVNAVLSDTSMLRFKFAKGVAVSFNARTQTVTMSTGCFYPESYPMNRMKAKIVSWLKRYRPRLTLVRIVAALTLAMLAAGCQTGMKVIVEKSTGCTVNVRADKIEQAKPVNTDAAASLPLVGK